MINAYFIGGNYEGCYYVRCFVPMCAGGWDGYRLSFRDTAKPGRQIAKEALQNDIIVFHRPFSVKMIDAIKKFKSAGKKIVVDNDDTYIPDSGTPTKVHGMDYKKVLEELDNNLKEAIQLADLVTVSTEHLRQEYEQIHDNIVVLPNMVDPYDWPEPKVNKRDRVRVGIWGSAASEAELEHIKPLLEELSVNSHVELVVFSFPPKRLPKKRATYADDIAYWEKLGAEIQNYVGMADYRDVLNDLNIDIGLIPRQNNYFNRAKSNIKFLEAAMVKTPVIAQGFESGDSPYQLNGAEYMEIADGLDEWREKVQYWIENPDIRREVAEDAYEYVKDEYDIDKNIHLWENAYKSLK